MEKDPRNHEAQGREELTVPLEAYCDNLTNMLGLIQDSEIAVDDYREFIGMIPRSRYAAILLLNESGTLLEGIDLLNLPSVQNRVSVGNKLDIEVLRELSIFSAGFDRDGWVEACRQMGHPDREHYAEPHELNRVNANYPEQSRRLFGDQPNYRDIALSETRKAMTTTNLKTAQDVDAANHRDFVCLIDIVSTIDALQLLGHFKPLAGKKDRDIVDNFAAQLNSSAFKDGKFRILRAEKGVGERDLILRDIGKFIGEKIENMPASSAGGTLLKMYNDLTDYRKESSTLRDIAATRLANTYSGSFFIHSNKSEAKQKKDKEPEQQVLAAARLAMEQSTQEKIEKAAQQKACANLLTTEASQLVHENSTIKSPWEMSKKQLQRSGLQDMQKALVKGVYGEEGEPVVEGRSKEQARELIGRLDRLSILSIQFPKPENLENYLIVQDEIEQGIKQKLDSVLERAEELPLRLKEPILTASANLFSTRECINGLREEWPVLGGVVREFWPNGKSVADSIENMLFEASEQIDLIEEDSTVLQAPSVETMDAKTLLGIADQLDKVILPPDAGVSELEEAVRQLEVSEAEISNIDWERLHNLVKIKENYNGTMYRSKKGNLGGAPPYYVVVIDFDGTNYAVADSPVEGNATYLVSEDCSPGSWLEVLSMTKKDARALGAVRVVHRKGATSLSHFAKIENALIDLMTVGEEHGAS